LISRGVGHTLRSTGWLTAITRTIREISPANGDRHGALTTSL
jgi:hypothetical protein